SERGCRSDANQLSFAGNNHERLSSNSDVRRELDQPILHSVGRRNLGRSEAGGRRGGFQSQRGVFAPCGATGSLQRQSKYGHDESARIRRNAEQTLVRGEGAGPEVGGSGT